MHCNSTVTSTGNFVASRSYCIFTVVTFYSVGCKSFLAKVAKVESYHNNQALSFLNQLHLQNNDVLWLPGIELYRKQWLLSNSSNISNCLATRGTKKKHIDRFDNIVCMLEYNIDLA